MNTGVIYVRVPADLKENVEEYATANNLQKTEAIVALLKKGLDFSSIEEKSADLQRKLADGQRARSHLEGILNIEIGRCSVQNCGFPISLNDFVFQRCPNGHYRTANLYDEFKKGLGVGEVVVAGLAIFGAVVAANQLLGGDSTT